MAMELNGRLNYRRKGLGSLSEIEEKYTVTRSKKRNVLAKKYKRHITKLQF